MPAAGDEIATPVPVTKRSDPMVPTSLEALKRALPRGTLAAATSRVPRPRPGHEQVRPDGPDLARGIEARVAAVTAGAGHEPIAAPQPLGRDRRLQGAAKTLRRGRGAVERT